MNEKKKKEIRYLCQSLFDTFYEKNKEDFDKGELLIEKVYDNNQSIYKSTKLETLVNDMFEIIVNAKGLKEINIKNKGKNLLPLQIN